MIVNELDFVFENGVLPLILAMSIYVFMMSLYIGEGNTT